MKRISFITGIVLLALAMGGSCILFHKRPWKTSSERTRFMLKMTAELVSPLPNHCIDELHKQLEKHSHVNSKTFHAHFPSRTLRDFPDAKIVLTQDAGKRSCEDALASCGNCHLPKKNNCRYEIHYGNGKKKFGLVEGRSFGKLMIRDYEEAKATSIPVSEIHKSVWLNGRDPLHTWWDFKNFGRKGETAKKMLHIAATNGVACTNCHVRHGDFRLTKEGVHFNKTGKVIKRVPLNAFQ